MNVHATHAVASPERLRALRLELAARRKACRVNVLLLFRQHDDRLRAAAGRCDRSGRDALGRLIDDTAAEASWTPATTRDLRAAVRSLSAAAARLSHAPAAADELAWLRDRLAEIAAQDARATALEAALGALRPAAADCGGALGATSR